jgi:hypothetical protein
MLVARLPSSTRVGTTDIRPYNLKDNALCGPVVRVPPGVSKDDLPADVELDWQVICFLCHSSC